MESIMGGMCCQAFITVGNSMVLWGQKACFALKGWEAIHTLPSQQPKRQCHETRKKHRGQYELGKRLSKKNINNFNPAIHHLEVHNKEIILKISKRFNYKGFTTLWFVTMAKEGT